MKSVRTAFGRLEAILETIPITCSERPVYWANPLKPSTTGSPAAKTNSNPTVTIMKGERKMLKMTLSIMSKLRSIHLFIDIKKYYR